MDLHKIYSTDVRSLPYTLSWKLLTFVADDIQDGWLSVILVSIALFVASVFAQKVYKRDSATATIHLFQTRKPGRPVNGFSDLFICLFIYYLLHVSYQ